MTIEKQQSFVKKKKKKRNERAKFKDKFLVYKTNFNRFIIKELYFKGCNRFNMIPCLLNT